MSDYLQKSKANARGKTHDDMNDNITNNKPLTGTVSMNCSFSHLFHPFLGKLQLLNKGKS
jgi:hypothetical protein